MGLVRVSLKHRRWIVAVRSRFTGLGGWVERGGQYGSRSRAAGALEHGSTCRHCPSMAAQARSLPSVRLRPSLPALWPPSGLLLLSQGSILQPLLLRLYTSSPVRALWIWSLIKLQGGPRQSRGGLNGRLLPIPLEFIRLG